MRIFPAIVALGLTGVGYLYHQEQKGQPEPLSKLFSSGAEFLGSVFAEDESADEEATSATDTAKTKQETDGEPKARGAEPVDFAEVFRFDVTTAHVSQTWNRVKSSPSDAALKGYRVPLATGSSDSDLTGSLTYYFDATQPRRITFTGTTSDPGRLVEFLERQYQFKRVSSRNGKVSTFSTRSSYSGLLRLTAPTKSEARFQIDLSIAQ